MTRAHSHTSTASRHGWRTRARVMSAAQLVRPREFEIVRTAAPCPGPGEVLVRLQGCGVCASNIPPWEGRDWFQYPMAPGALGHEGWGIVEEAGLNVAALGRGDRVALLSHHSYAEYDIASEADCIRLPADLGDGPFPGEALGCAMNIYRRAEIAPEQCVAIVGVGFLGAVLTQLCVQRGATVIAISRRAFALSVAREAGAAECLRMDDRESVLSQVHRLTDGRLCDCVIEATGVQGPLDLAGELTRQRGRLIIAGYHQDGPRQVNMQQWNWRGIDVINAHERDPEQYRAGMRQAIEAVVARHLDIGPLCTHEFPLERINETMQCACDRPDGFLKAVLTYDHSEDGSG